MDDDQLRTAIRAMAEPRDPGPRAHADVLAAVEQQRRKRRVASAAAAVVTVAAIAVGAVAVASQPPRGPAAGAHDVELTASGGVYGFQLKMTVRFPDSRQLLSAYYDIGGRRTKVTLYPGDGSDNDNYPTPLAVAAGVAVQVSAVPDVSCISAATVPELVVTSEQEDGRTYVDRFTASNPDDYSAEVTSWCPRGPYVGLVEARGGNDDTAVVELQIVNPSDVPIHVVSQAFNRQGAQWHRSSVVVPAGATRLMTITASGLSYFATPDKPWTTGHLRSNGEPITVNSR